MTISSEDVKRVAQLARIELNQEEIRQIGSQLANIFGLIEKMQLVDTHNVMPMSHAQDVTLRLREDKATDVDAYRLFQEIAPQTEAGLYLVPKVVE